MKKFSDFIKKSAEPQKKEPASNVIKGRFKIAKSDDDKHLAFGWANVTDEDVWEKVKDGTYPMFSIEGEAERVEVEDENTL